MIRSLLQTALDAALYPNVQTHWQRKSGADADEYIVYTQGGDEGMHFADNVPVVKAASVTIRYYYREDKLDTHAGRQAIQSREGAIETALKNAGFSFPFGKVDAGDVDDIGYFTSVWECDYWRVV